MSGFRLPPPHGAWIDRRRPIRFRFDGQQVPAFAGDTVASALLAHGIVQVGRSVKLHRPRGVVGCGVEEPCAMVDVGTGGARSPGMPATLVPVHDGLDVVSANAWPTRTFDLAAVNDRLAALLPPGFYYKTFTWPHWHWFEPAIRRLAGQGHAADAPDPDRYDEVSDDIDLLVVGGGACGMQAATAAARAGRSVTLLEAEPRLGGRLAGQAPEPERLACLLRDVTASGVRVLTCTTALGLYDHGLAVAVQAIADAGEGRAPAGLPPVRERLWRLRTRQLVLATGAFERPMLFPDNDRPGVMIAGAMLRHVVRHGVAPARRVLVAAATDAAYGVAIALQAAGITVVAIVDRRSPDRIGVPPPPGIDVLAGCAIVGVAGTRAVRAVDIGGAVRRRYEVDGIASGGGFVPDVALFAQAGGRLRWVDDAAMLVPDRMPAGVAVVGACAGVFDPAAAQAHAEAVGRLGPDDPPPAAPVGGCGHVPADTRPDADWLPRRRGRIFVDLQNDVTADDIALAARENYHAVEHLKRYTATGMGTDQGRTANVNALVVLGASTGRAVPEVGTTRFRPPYRPVTLGALAGARVGARIRPLKPLPARAFHHERGALFEEFGGWERPAAYPRIGESLEQAALREAGAVRATVGLFDASPLGKLEVCGPDAADFLDRMYVGTLSTLPVGGARYAAMLNEHGVLVDDGIVARLGPQRFWVNTTSAGAERAVGSFEEWLQCEYVRHRVIVVPVTAQWGTVAVAGPRAWALLRQAGFDDALAPQAMRHLTIRDLAWDGLPARVLRASFSGELGYEVNVPASATGRLLSRLWAAGQSLGVTAYGVEALMILRTEKGYLHVGVDTDGTTLPQDVGLGRGIAAKATDFVGRRSLLRPAAGDDGRLQLVGLQPADRRTRIAVGAHLALAAPPSRADGHVTSSCHSPTLGQPIALALLRDGRRRLGERLRAWHLGNAVEVDVVRTPFLDPDGSRLRG